MEGMHDDPTRRDESEEHPQIDPQHPTESVSAVEPTRSEPSPPAYGVWAELPPPPPGYPASPPPPPPPPPRRSGATIVAAILVGIMLIAAGAGIGWVTGHRSSSATSPGGPSNPLATVPQTVPSSGQGAEAPSADAIANQVDPAIVDVNTYTTRSGLVGGQLLPLGAGTGMVVTSGGEVLTNNHVVDGAISIRVTIQGRPGSYPADVVGVDPTADVALIQIEGVSALPTVTLSDSSGVRIGQTIFAIGNALGKGGVPSISQGSVSATGRSINVANDHGSREQLSNLIQIDASISPGDSGGAVVNGSGQVIGMITAAATYQPNQRVSNIGYAIPVNAAITVVNQIRSGRAGPDIIIGKAGYIGVSVREIDAAVAAQLGLDVNSGVLVVTVAPGGPAAGSGMRQNSVITNVDGQPIRTIDELAGALHHHPPGAQVRITWVDANGSHQATLRLVEGPAV